jgi:DNA-directed DNA polymerase
MRTFEVQNLRNMQKLMLLDAYALIFRAYYGLIRSPRINSKGENTSAVFGFVNTLEELLRTEQPDFLAVAFDPPGGTFRHEAFADYKAQREETPAGIKWAVPVIKDILEAYGIVACEVKGFEADDVIGTLALQGQAAGLDVLMVTPDKDYAQLVRPGITMCRPSSGKSGLEKLDVEAVCEKYGLAHPAQVIDMLALMGDAADNIPGCPGVGPKTAVKLLAEFENVEQLIENVEQLKGSLRQKVSDHVEDIRNSKFLATIVTDVPIELDLDAMKRREPNKEKLKNIFEACEFRTFIQRFLGESPNAKTNAVEEPDLFAPQGAENGAESGNLSTNYAQSSQKTLQDTEHDYVLIDNLKDATALCGNLLTFPIVAFDTETTGIDAMSAEMVGMSFAVEGGRAWYVAVPENQAEAQEFVDAFRPFFENEGQIKVGQNLKYDLTILSHYGVEVKGELFDTMLAHYVVEPEQRHNMDHLAETYLHYRTIHIEELIGTGRQQKNMRDLAPSEICDYACEDADVTLRLYPILREKMAECDVTDVFSKIEMPLLPVLARIEQNGVRLDTEALQQTGDDFRARLQTLEEEVYALAGHEFTITSPKQVGTVLFEELKISEKARKTKTGQYSTSEEVLETLRDKHPIVEKILAHRALKKLLSTYVEALPKLINPRTGRIHTSFNQAVTATGRLSSSNPNLQNIPVRGEDGREIRKAFVPDEDCTFFSADYSQIELRIMAHLSGDEHMIADFNAGHDIHAATAARIFHKSIDEVTRDERRKAKTANFGIIYGISAFGLSERLGIPRGEAKELIDSYFDTYPKVKEFMSTCIERAQERGYILTEFKRRRYLADINSRNATVRGYAERNAVNAPIQGTAADIIKVAMVAIDRRLREEHLDTKMILQVHDELNFSVPHRELDTVRQLVVEEMERAYSMRVPLLAECGSGTNWLEAH